MTIIVYYQCVFLLFMFFMPTTLKLFEVFILINGLSYWFWTSLSVILQLYGDYHT